MTLREHTTRVVRFGGVSGTGLALDYTLYTLLHLAGLPATGANILSATAAVSFVYVASLRRVFAHLPTPPRSTFARYLAYQAIAVPTASIAVGTLESALGGRFLLAKTLVVPFSFAANYLFMHWLLHRSPTHS